MTSETDEQTAARLGVSLEDYRKTIAPVESKAGEFAGHSAGDWIAYGHLIYHVGKNGKGNTVVARASVRVTEIEEKANAALIAAAPALLAERDTLRQRVERLEKALRTIKDDPYTSCYCSQIASDTLNQTEGK